MTMAGDEYSVTPRALVGTATLTSTSHGRSYLQNVGAAPSEVRPPQTLQLASHSLSAFEAHMKAQSPQNPSSQSSSET